MTAALSHIRVLDLSRILAGPWASQILADLGAAVIKIERPGVGDDTRTWGPPFHQGTAAYFLGVNRGKQSVTVDLTKPAGQEIIRRLAREADVLLENHKVGDLARFGLAYADLQAINPRLVYCSITGFGQTGPYAGRAGYDLAIQAMGGLMSVTGESDGAPQKVGVAMADLMAGMYACVAVLAALSHREVSGAGQYIDLALLDVQVATLANVALNYLLSGVVPGRWGSAHPNIAPYRAYDTADRPIILAVGNDGQFQSFCRVAGAAALASTVEYATNAGRVTHRDALDAAVTKIMRARPSARWLEDLSAAGVPCAPINDIAQVFADPQVAQRGMRVTVPDGQGGTLPLVASPLHLSATPVTHDVPPPRLGQHTEEILRERLGMSVADVARLRADGVI